MEVDRTSIEAGIERLRKQRGAAVLDGKKADKISDEIASLKGELDARTDAESERVNRERVAAEAARIKRLEILEVERSASMRAYSEDAVEMEQHIRAAAAAIERLLTHAAKIASTTHQITGQVPTPLMGREVESRLGSFVAAVMRANRFRLGPLEWPANPHWKPDDRFHEREASLLAAHIKQGD